MAEKLKKKTVLGSLLSALLLVATSTLYGQAAPLPDWRTLSEESQAVLVGEVVEGYLWVIDSQRKDRAEVTPDGKPTSANPELYTLGSFSRVRVQEAIKKDRSIKEGETVCIFIHGYLGFDRPDPLLGKRKYVLFLRPLEADEKVFKNALVERAGPPASLITRTKFDPKDCYTPVREGLGQVFLKPDRMQILDEIMRALAKHR